MLKSSTYLGHTSKYHFQYFSLVNISTDFLCVSVNRLMLSQGCFPTLAFCGSVIQLDGSLYGSLFLKMCKGVVEYIHILPSFNLTSFLLRCESTMSVYSDLFQTQAI